MAFWKPGTSGPSFERDSHERGEYSSTLHVKHNITRQDLPVYAHRLELLYSIEHFRVVLVIGETGSGKSTQLPQYLVENGWATGGRKVLCTQPRRIAALSLATRVAAEMGTRVGEKVVHQSILARFLTTSRSATLFALRSVSMSIGQS